MIITSEINDKYHNMMKDSIEKINSLRHVHIYESAMIMTSTNKILTSSKNAAKRFVIGLTGNTTSVSYGFRYNNLTKDDVVSTHYAAPSGSPVIAISGTSARGESIVRYDSEEKLLWHTGARYMNEKRKDGIYDPSKNLGYIYADSFDDAEGIAELENHPYVNGSTDKVQKFNAVRQKLEFGTYFYRYAGLNDHSYEAVKNKNSSIFHDYRTKNITAEEYNNMSSFMYRLCENNVDLYSYMYPGLKNPEKIADPNKTPLASTGIIKNAEDYKLVSELILDFRNKRLKKDVEPIHPYIDICSPMYNDPEYIKARQAVDVDNDYSENLRIAEILNPVISHMFDHVGLLEQKFAKDHYEDMANRMDHLYTSFQAIDEAIEKCDETDVSLPMVRLSDFLSEEDMETISELSLYSQANAINKSRNKNFDMIGINLYNNTSKILQRESIDNNTVKTAERNGVDLSCRTYDRMYREGDRFINDARAEFTTLYRLYVDYDYYFENGEFIENDNPIHDDSKIRSLDLPMMTVTRLKDNKEKGSKFIVNYNGKDYSLKDILQHEDQPLQKYPMLSKCNDVVSLSGILGETVRESDGSKKLQPVYDKPMDMLAAELYKFNQDVMSSYDQKVRDIEVKLLDLSNAQKSRPLILDVSRIMGKANAKNNFQYGSIPTMCFKESGVSEFTYTDKNMISNQMATRAAKIRKTDHYVENLPKVEARIESVSNEIESAINKRIVKCQETRNTPEYYNALYDEGDLINMINAYTPTTSEQVKIIDANIGKSPKLYCPKNYVELSILKSITTDPEFNRGNLKVMTNDKSFADVIYDSTKSLSVKSKESIMSKLHQGILSNDSKSVHVYSDVYDALNMKAFTESHISHDVRKGTKLAEQMTEMDDTYDITD